MGPRLAPDVHEVALMFEIRACRYKRCFLYHASLSAVQTISSKASVACHSLLYPFFITHILPRLGCEAAWQTLNHRPQTMLRVINTTLLICGAPAGFSATYHIEEGAGAAVNVILRTACCLPDIYRC